jgi:hypothetical protein
MKKLQEEMSITKKQGAAHRNLFRKYPPIITKRCSAPEYKNVQS